MNHLNIDRAQARVFMQRMLGEGLITKVQTEVARACVCVRELWFKVGYTVSVVNVIAEAAHRHLSAKAAPFSVGEGQ